MSDGGSSPRRWRRPWTLRFRVTAAFAVGSLAIVAMLGIVTYEVSQHYLVQQRQRSLLRRSFVDARVVRDEVQRGKEVNAVLAGLDLGNRSNIMIRTDGRWHVTAGSKGQPEDLPRGMVATVEGGAVARQMRIVDGLPTFAVGVPIPAIRGEVYSTFVLVELHRTLGTLRTALVGGGIVAVMLAALLGWWMSGRILRPVRNVALAAERVAGGDLDTRLPAGPDADLRSLVASFNHMVDAVKTRIDRETRFVADVSHELRSPLTTLSTATQVMATSRDELSPRGVEALDHLQIEVQRFQQLVDDLLELGHAEAGPADLQLEPVDVGELVRQGLASRDNWDVQVVVPATSVRARLDKRRLARVLANLVTNAETHGGGLRRVEVTRRNGSVRVEVEDQGPGVDPGERDVVFDRFFRGAAAGRRGSTAGAGLGLALVAEHVQVQGGRVWVEDGNGGGARFVVELPAEEP